MRDIWRSWKLSLPFRFLSTWSSPQSLRLWKTLKSTRKKPCDQLESIPTGPAPELLEVTQVPEEKQCKQQDSTLYNFWTWLRSLRRITKANQKRVPGKERATFWDWENHRSGRNKMAPKSWKLTRTVWQNNQSAVELNTTKPNLKRVKTRRKYRKSIWWSPTKRN